jgi:hypothetical protein
MIKLFSAVALVLSTQFSIAQGKSDDHNSIFQGKSDVHTPAILLTDVSGKTVGRYSNSHVYITLPSGEIIGVRFVPDNPRSSGFKWASDDRRFFTNTNCTGQAFLAPPQAPSGSRRLAAVYQVGNQYFAAISEPTLNNITPRLVYSMTNINITETGCQSIRIPPLELVPVNETINLDSYGIAPFFIK